MKIKSIYIDGLHNATNKTYNFDDIVYLFGNNGAGKSTVLQAIQFVLLGYIPGTAKNSKEAILRHSPKGDITVKLTFDDGLTLERRLLPGGSRLIVNPEEDFDISAITKELELPIFNFNEFVGQTANKLKEYFIKNILPTANGVLDWQQILADSVADCNFEDRDAIINYGMSLLDDLDGDILEQVVQANAKFKADQSFNKSEIQRLQNTIDSLIYYDDYVGPNNLDDLISKRVAVNALRDQLIKYETASKSMQAAKDALAKSEEQIVSLGGRERYDLCINQYKQLKTLQDDLTVKITETKSQISILNSEISNMDAIIRSEGICTYTKLPCDSMIAKLEVLKKELSAKREEVHIQVAHLEYLSSEYDTCLSNISNYDREIRQFNALWDKIANLTSTVGEIPQAPDTNKTISELDIELEQLDQSRTKLMANIKYNETIDTLTKMKFETELRGEALSKWVKKTDTNGLQTTLMEKPFEELADTMTGYIQQMYGNSNLKAHFNLSTKANSFSFGLIRNNIYIPYDMLSSGEKCLYTLALMICIVNNNKSPLKLLLCDDMFDHLDSTAIENTFASLKNIKDVQFIFAGVKDCNNARDVMIHI